MTSNKRLMLLILGFVLFVFTLNAVNITNGSEFIPMGSWMYEALDTLFYEQGRVLPFSTRPYAVDEFKYHFSQLNEEKLSVAGKDTFDRLKAALPEVKEGKFGAKFGTTAIISPEFYLNSNKELIRDGGSQHYLYDYERGYVERLPILSVPISFWAGNYLYTEIDIDIKEQPGMGVYPKGEFPEEGEPYVNWSNVPIDMNHMLQHFPDSYYMSFGDTHWNIFLGSAKYSIGVGQTGTLILSEDANKIPGLRFSWYNDWFRYNFTYLSLNPAVGNSGAYNVGAVDRGMALDLPALTARYRTSGTNPYGDDYKDYMDEGLYPYKGYLTHTMEFRLFKDILYIGVTEAAVYGRAVPELFMAMPLAFWHNGNNGAQTNSLLSLDLQVAAGKWAQVYASGVLDQFAMAHEDDSEDPTAWGFLAGVLGRWNLGKGYLTGGFEYVQTNQWLYTHAYWMETPTVAQRNTALTRGGYDIRLLGYNKGNDFSQFHVEAGYVRPGNWDVTLSYNYGLKGPFDVFARKPVSGTLGESVDWTYPEVAAMPVAVQNQVALVGHYYWGEGLAVGGYLYFTKINNYKNIANNTMQNVEFTLSVSIDPFKVFKKATGR